MTASGEKDYVLGTHEDEVARLQLQHGVWREAMLSAFGRVGIGHGARVIDIGAGPGYATMDLAHLVSGRGSVVAIERSKRFLEHASTEISSKGLRNVELIEHDLMGENLPELAGDAAFCRWVASFVPSLPRLVEQLARVLHAGGLAIFHEYVDYAAFRLAPDGRFLSEFVREVMASWRASGGEPDVAAPLVKALSAAGFRLRALRPLPLCVRPHEPAWAWPAVFIKVNLERLLNLGRIQPALADSVLAELKSAEANPDSFILCPLVLEIVAERARS